MPLNIVREEVLVKTTGADSSGRFAFFHLTAPTMSGPPLHVHTKEDELFYVLEGELVFQIAGERVTAGPGTTAFFPRGVVHTYQNFREQPARLLIMVTPSGFDTFFEELSAGTAPGQLPDMEFFNTLLGKYGMTMLGPPLS
jgi:mannose-6-phosphate isomerase-like protein (cupin superfamily)